MPLRLHHLRSLSRSAVHALTFAVVGASLATGAAWVFAAYIPLIPEPPPARSIVYTTSTRLLPRNKNNIDNLRHVEVETNRGADYSVLAVPGYSYATPGSRNLEALTVRAHAGWPRRCYTAEFDVHGLTLFKKGREAFWPAPSPYPTLWGEYRSFRVDPRALAIDAGAFGTPLLVLALGYRCIRSILRAGRGRCPRCNYNQRGLTPGAPCPECARPNPVRSRFIRRLQQTAYWTVRVGLITATLAIGAPTLTIIGAWGASLWMPFEQPERATFMIRSRYAGPVETVFEKPDVEPWARPIAELERPNWTPASHPRGDMVIYSVARFGGRGLDRWEWSELGSSPGNRIHRAGWPWPAFTCSAVVAPASPPAPRIPVAWPAILPSPTLVIPSTPTWSAALEPPVFLHPIFDGAGVPRPLPLRVLRGGFLADCVVNAAVMVLISNIPWLLGRHRPKPPPD